MKKHENENRKSPYMLISFPIKTEESRPRGGGRDWPASPPWPPRRYSPPSTSFLFTTPPSQSPVPPWPPLPLQGQWRGKHGSSRGSLGRATSPRPHHRSGLQLRPPCCGAQQRGPIPQGLPWPVLLPILIAALQQYSATSSFMPRVL